MTCTRTPARFAAMLAIAAALTAPHTARATPTDPVLAIYTASAARGESTTRVQLTATFPQRDLVQIPYAVQVVVWDGVGGSHFLRFDLSGGTFEGDFPSLADGLDAADASLLATAGSATATARHVQVTLDRISLELPASFSTVDARAQMFVIDDGSPVLSNEQPISVVVDAGAGGGQ